MTENNEGADDSSPSNGWADRSVKMVGRYFGPFLQNIGDIAADQTALWKIQQRIRIARKVERLIAETGIEDRARAIPNRVGIPLLEALEMESDDGLQEVWAAYIRNALDPAKPEDVANRQLIDIIRILEPSDLVVLNLLFAQDLETPVRSPSYLHWMTSPSSEVTIENLITSLDRLAAAGLLKADTEGGSRWAPNEDYRAPCQVKIGTPSGTYTTMHLLLVLKRSIT